MCECILRDCVYVCDDLRNVWSMFISPVCVSHAHVFVLQCVRVCKCVDYGEFQMRCGVGGFLQ